MTVHTRQMSCSRAVARDWAACAAARRCSRRLRRRPGLPQGDEAMQAAISIRRSRTTAPRRRPTPTTRTTRSRSSAPCWPPRAPTSIGRASSRSRISSKRRAASTAWPPSTTRPTARRRPRSSRSTRSSAQRIEAARPRPAIEQLRERARAASAPPMLNPASREPLDPLHQRQPARHPEQPRRTAPASTSPTTATSQDRADRPIAARRRHARAGAQADDDDEPAVVQGAERALDLRLPGHDSQARAVRRAGDPDVLRLARGRDRADADPQRHHPASRHRRSSRHPVEQDEQHDRRARVTAGRRDHRARSSRRTTSRAPRSSSTSRSSKSTGRAPSSTG